MRRLIAVVAAVACLSGTPAIARHHHSRHHIAATSDGRPAAWCGWFMMRLTGYRDRALYVARNWAHVGQAAPGPAPGVVGVKAHHVFRVVSIVAPGKVLAISGNDGHAVRTRVRSTAGVIAWRVP